MGVGVGVGGVLGAWIHEVTAWRRGIPGCSRRGVSPSTGTYAASWKPTAYLVRVRARARARIGVRVRVRARAKALVLD